MWLSTQNRCLSADVLISERAAKKAAKTVTLEENLLHFKANGFLLGFGGWGFFFGVFLFFLTVKDAL